MTSRPRTGRTILPYKVQTASGLPSADLYKADLEHFRHQAEASDPRPGRENARPSARMLGLAILGGLVSGAMIGMSVMFAAT
ncbi:hypothetical protein [Rubellimicrobium roseum]|uniref:Uncharacterized protein n=1 Tax=Rubellimicrobium roseum TaxID=687525 RepID=A0A5C4NLM8_9RHOB|nr:hypothetical protein [Rubellimicrobium roseum]TNC74890.1 hypothetical protein FHG71_01805 [Rubellimicrobium roseum]